MPFKEKLKSLNDNMLLMFLVKKHYNNAAFNLAIHPKQIDCIMKFVIWYTAECKKLSTLQLSPLQIVSI